MTRDQPSRAARTPAPTPIEETPVLFRLKKLVGTVILLVFVPTYALFALALATAILPGTNSWTQLGYYALAGVAWVLPAGLIVYWMFKPKPAA